MKHLFVPYELALLAKEKGYLEQCLADYTIQNKELELRDTAYNKIWSREISIEKKPKYIAAPLYQQLVDWFREKHGVFIYPSPLRARGSWKWNIELTTHLEFHSGNYYPALEKALTEAFKLI